MSSARVRGGSWFNDRNFARSTNRAARLCNNYGSVGDLGFRLVCASPIF